MRRLDNRFSAVTAAVVLALSITAIGCGDTLLGDDGPSTPYPGGRWSPPEPTFGNFTQTDVELPMSDGVILVADVNYPADLETGERANGSFPVILTQNPYGGNIAATAGSFFVSRGYIFAGVDVRGTSRSGGSGAELFTPRTAEDGAELVAWASRLGGSDGNVGLWGCSFLGINQLEAATQLGPDSPVKAMIPGCFTGDSYRDTLFDNGIPGPIATAWPGVWPDALPGGDRGYYRDYWRNLDRVARAPAIAATGIPMLMWVGWGEGGALGALELYAALQNLSAGRGVFAPMRDDQPVTGRYQAIIGDWAHAGGLDQGIELQWYDTWIKGIDTGLPKNTRTPLHLQELASNRWINAKRYPLTDDSTALYLTQAGELAGSAAAAGRDTLTWVPPEEVSASVEYTSAPFSDGAVLAGPMAARLEISSSNTNAQLLIELLDVAPDGARAVISHGSVLGSRRGLDTDRSWTDADGELIRPYLALDRDEPLLPDQRTGIDVPLVPTLWSIEPGHRLGVRLSTRPRAENCGFVIGNPPWGCNLTEPMRETLPGGVYTIHYGGTSASSVRLPLIAHGSFETSRSITPPTVRDGSTLPGDW
ncbi:MAG: CocE/NonD family hydrolase [Candidatus Binatia bacterium]|nr:CocE/NonD family hydrolase [Candidatus Binatia bacterium]